MKDLMDKWNKFVASMNSKGIPVPMIRDPKSQTGSVSLTLTFISFNIWVVSVIGKAAGALGGMDPSACLQMFLACAGLYWGRKFQRDEKGGASLDGDSKKGE